MFNWLTTPENYERYPFQAEIILLMMITGRRAEETMKIRKTMIDYDKEVKDELKYKFLLICRKNSLGFVDFIRGDEDGSDEADKSQVETAKALFKSLGDIDHSISLSDDLKDSDILIVDDNKTNCEVLERRLSMSGLKSRTAYDGETALAEVKKKTPDLILLDVILPDINGLELLKRFRSKHTNESLPVIMVSAFDDVDSIAKCIQLGAQDYLPKPINGCLLYTSPSPRDRTRSRMPSSA